MKDIVRILMVLLFVGSECIHAEEITITTPISVNLSARKNLLQLSFSGAFQMDSGWIVSAKDTTRKELVFRARSGDYINVSKLERGYYKLYAQAPDTCIAKLFYKRDGAVAKELDILSADVQITAPHTLQYSIREAGKSEAPHVDSVWIVGKSYACATPDTVYMRTTAQPGDDIDLQPLLGQTENEFQCVAWINGTDYWSNSFYYGGECEAYGEIEVHYTHINPHHLILDIKNAGEPASADSLWISSAYDDHRTLMTVTAVSDGDTIDLSPLVGMSEQEYLTWLRFGECVKVYAFDFNGLDYDYCLEAGVWWVHLETDNSAHVLRYYLRDYGNQDIQNMPVDSAWISTWGIDVTPEYVCSVDAQPGEAINILPLKNGYYELSVQVGECIVSMPFQAYKSQSEGIEGVLEAQPAMKVLREGKIVIVRGGKTYTLTGQGTLL